MNVVAKHSFLKVVFVFSALLSMSLMNYVEVSSYTQLKCILFCMVVI